MRYAAPQATGRGPRVHLWFWGWLVTAAALALVSVLRRDRGTAPFAVGAACAAAADAAGLAPAVQWLAVLAVSSALFVLLNRRHYRARHGDRGLGRHRAHEDEAPHDS